MNIKMIGDKIPSATFKIQSRFNHVVNYENVGCLISFVDSEKSMSGRSVFVHKLPVGNEDIQICPDFITINGVKERRAAALSYDSSFSGIIGLDQINRQMRVLKEVLITESPELSLAVVFDSSRKKEFASGFEKAMLNLFNEAYALILEGDVLHCAEMFKGVGFGLTPSGDDFIVGMLYSFSAFPDNRVLSSLKSEIVEITSSCTKVSRQFIKDAASGIYPKDVKELLESMLLGEDEQLKRAARKLIEHGHSSGSDTITGLIAGFEWIISPFHNCNI